MKLVKDRLELEECCAAMSGEDVVGLDLETTGLDPHKAVPRLVQLSTAKEVYVIDLFAVSETEALKRLLAAPRPL